MKNLSIRAAAFLLLSFATTASAGVLYVNVNGANPTPPYASWATAATSIQDAIDASTAGDQVLVTNGVYADGGRVAFGSLTNRVVVDKAVTLQSVNGPSATEIRGNFEKGDNAVRCVYLTTNSVLIGFSLNQGATREDGDISQEQSGGGVWCASTNVLVTNCFIENGIANQLGGGGYGGTFDHCTLSNNLVDTGSYWTTAGGAACSSTLFNCLLVTNRAAGGGGGAASCTLISCQLVGNSATWAGGAEDSFLSRCTVAGSSAQSGAGLYVSTASDCLITGNFGQFGGGAEFCTLTNCILANNRTFDDESLGLGGGADQSILYNCLVYGNVSATSAGVSGSTLNNCTVVSNITTQVGGAVDSCAINNSIVYDNLSPDVSPNYSSSSSTFSCVTPLPDDGFEDFSDDPQFVDPDANDFHLQAGSPCINTGYNLLVPTAIDLDGNVRVAGGRVDVGAYEFQPPIHYVDVNGTNAIAPYLSWDTAATTIQDAVDAAAPGDEVRVTNGVYQAGGKIAFGALTNRVTVDKMLALRSVNGAAATVIVGNPEIDDNAVRCVYLTNNTLLQGFTLMSGGTRAANDEPFEEQSGGGLWGNSYDAVAQDCVLVSNTAALYGGGAYGGVLNGCSFTDNSSPIGAGANFSLLNNCTLTGNVADDGGAGFGGAANDSVLTECVLAGNSSDVGGGVSYSTLTDCVLTNNFAGYGGGIIYSTSTNCIFIANTVSGDGGAANSSTLVGCTISSNTAEKGGGGADCVLQGCTIVNNTASTEGGGASEGSVLDHCSIVGNLSAVGGGAKDSNLSNCVLSNNIASVLEEEGGLGGGAEECNLTNCLLVGNIASDAGGAANSQLENCTVAGNTADSAGGLDGCGANNCIVYLNSAATNPNYTGGFMDYSCTTPLPLDGTQNFTNDPAFADPGNGDYHLQEGSPCINAANSNYVTYTNDLDDNVRIVSTMVDAGAYEYQTPASALSYAWLIQHGLPTDGSADFADTDGDGVDNFHEWMANTDPNDPNSTFKVLSITKDDSGVTITWASDPDRVYTIERSTDLNQAPAFSVFATEIPGDTGTSTTTFEDFDTDGHDQLFYRVDVQFGPPPPPQGS